MISFNFNKYIRELYFRESIQLQLVNTNSRRDFKPELSSWSKIEMEIFRPRTWIGFEIVTGIR